MIYTFELREGRNHLDLGSGVVFERGVYVTNDPLLAERLRKHPMIAEKTTPEKLGVKVGKPIFVVPPIDILKRYTKTQLLDMIVSLGAGDHSTDETKAELIAAILAHAATDKIEGDLVPVVAADGVDD